MRDLIAETAKAVNDGYRYIVHEGGARSGKTHSILTVLYHLCRSRPSIGSVVSESVPHLKRGAVRDYQRIQKAQGIWNDKEWNKTDFVHQISPDRMLEFFSVDNSDKVHGPERDFLFINEAQNISYDTAKQLFVRTRKIVFIDFNPTREFWAHTELKNEPKTKWIHSTYVDNNFLTKEQIEEIERGKNNKSWWAIYGLGQIAESEAQIYTGWQIIDDIPHEARLERYGLDFGYSIDPTVIEAIYWYNGGWIIDEVTYTKGLSNKAIADIFLNLPRALVIADGAEPKSVDEISSYGVTITAAIKGPGSVLQGIQYVQQQKISVTKRSLKTIKAYRNYLWSTDRKGNILNVPDDTIHEWSNAMDATRYGFNGFIINQQQEERYVPEYRAVDPVLGI
jgi:phage terminase large subunit